ncbi:MAG: GDP-mannose 4,6-dehydratase [Phycisphaeraceae bacterium]|nr:GDP-mannose 4,6-dehydratase [Phycisphaeraceae bacterium]
MTRTVMVLGSNAFSGQDLVDLLLDDPGYRVIGVSRSAELPGWRLRYRARQDQERFSFFRLDFNRDMEGLLALLDLERPWGVVNFAAQSEVAPSWEHPEHWFQTNTVALARLINHLRRRDYLERYLHVSSPEVYGACVGTVREDAGLNPSTPYAASKAAADLLLGTFRKQFNFPLLTVRATNVYGARQQLFKIIPRSAIYLKMGKKIPLHGGGQAVKSYIHVRDVSRGELAILERGRVGELYHLSPDQGVAVREVVGAMARRMKIPWEQAVEIVAERPGQDAAYVIDSGKARTELGWRPTIGLEEGLAEVTAWVEAHWEAISSHTLDYVHRA